jgi:hypothetical protein
MIYSTRNAPSSTDTVPSTDDTVMTVFREPAPTSVFATAQSVMTLFSAVSPDETTTFGTGLVPGAKVDVSREPVGSSVVQLAPRTVSAGNESTPAPVEFDLPLKRNGWAYRLMSGPMRTTILAPELQSELDEAGDANTMKRRGMTAPFTVIPPQPWYESFSKTLGR